MLYLTFCAPLPPRTMKGNRKGDDTDCRMDYIRMLVSISHKLKDGHSLILLKRDHCKLVPYIRSLMMACPGNHTMTLTCDASRWRRKYEIWKRAVENNETQVGQKESRDLYNNRKT